MLAFSWKDFLLRHKVLLTVCVWFTVNFFIVSHFPTVFIDEAENANHAYNLAQHGESLFSLYDDLYPESLYMFRHAWPVVIRPFFSHPLSWFIRLTHFDFVIVRSFSLLVGFFSLLLIYWIGTLLKDEKLGFLALLILGTRFLFLYSSHTIRPEIVLCFAGLVSFCLFLMGLRSQSMGYFLAGGFIAGASPGIHTNGLALALSLAILPLLDKNRRAFFLTVSGMIGGIAFFLLSADWDRFLPSLSVLFYREFTTPPVVAHKANIFSMLTSEIQRYFGSWIFMNWKGGRFFQILMGWQTILIAAGVAWGCLQKERIRLPSQLAALLALTYALLVSQKAANYLTVLEPWFALSLASWLLSGRFSLGRKELLLVLSLILLVFPLGQMPLMVMIASFLILPRKAIPWILGILFGIVAFNFEAFQSWFANTRSFFFVTWGFSLAGLILLGYWFVWTQANLFRSTPSLTSFGMILLGLITLGTVLFVGSVTSYKPNFTEICRTFSSQMKPGSRVAGPQFLWLGLHTFNYRDIGALTWHRLLLNQKDLITPLENFRPNYIIVDRSNVGRFRVSAQRMKQKTLLRPTGLFPWPHKILQIMPTGPAYSEELALIEINWLEEDSL